MLLSIAVKPYMLKFLTRHLGADYKLATSDVYGAHLFGLLRQPRDHRQYENFLARYTAEFPVHIVPYLFADRACKNCSPLTIVKFNSFAEAIFFAEFHQFVEFRVEEMNLSAKEATERFCTKFGLTEDDIKYETLKRNWHRYQKREKKRLEKAKSPSSLSLAA